MANKTTATSAKTDRRSPSAKRIKACDGENAIQVANRFILASFPFGVMAGEPQALVLQGNAVWIVPVVLTSPGIGAVGQVGIVAVDGASGAILGSTPRAQVVAAGKRLCEENDDALEAAFLRARKKV